MTNSNPNKQELLSTIESIGTMLIEIASNNDHTIKQTDYLKIILFNLQIESAHINQLNGIKPITYELQKLINELHDKTYNTVLRRQELINKLNIIQDYIMNIEE